MLVDLLSLHEPQQVGRPDQQGVGKREQDYGAVELVSMTNVAHRVHGHCRRQSADDCNVQVAEERAYEQGEEEGKHEAGLGAQEYGDEHRRQWCRDVVRVNVLSSHVGGDTSCGQRHDRQQQQLARAAENFRLSRGEVVAENEQDEDGKDGGGAGLQIYSCRILELSFHELGCEGLKGFDVDFLDLRVLIDDQFMLQIAPLDAGNATSGLRSQAFGFVSVHNEIWRDEQTEKLLDRFRSNRWRGLLRTNPSTP